MKEIQKLCNINIDVVLNSIHHCYEIIQELVSLETDPLFMETESLGSEFFCMGHLEQENPVWLWHSPLL